MDKDEKRLIMILLGIAAVCGLIVYFLVVPTLPKPNEYSAISNIIERR